MADVGAQVPISSTCLAALPRLQQGISDCRARGDFVTETLLFPSDDDDDDKFTTGTRRSFADDGRGCFSSRLSGWEEL